MGSLGVVNDLLRRVQSGDFMVTLLHYAVISRDQFETSRFALESMSGRGREGGREVRDFRGLIGGPRAADGN